MRIEQIYTDCLAQGTYYIESNGEVAIIDPLREVKPYIKKAKENNASIKYIFETHFHADFVSGHVTLSKATGAPIVFGPNAKTNFKTIVATDGQEFKLGKVTITAIHTPGHTMESTCYLLKDTTGKNHALFSGDTLFLGDVGRPDLAQKEANITQEVLAGILYDSLRNKIMTLNDEVLVYPAHGAGSACGKNLSKETVGTIGDQKYNNYALRASMTKEEFIKQVTDGLLPPPIYFPANVKLNKEGYKDIDQVLATGTKALNPQAFEQLANESGALILDVRHQDDFAKGHIPNAIFIGLNGGFAPWVGALIGDVKHPILLVTPKGSEKEAVTRLSRVGFDNTLGYLEGGFYAWQQSDKGYDIVQGIDADKLKLSMPQKPSIFDVREVGEFTSERIPSAKHMPLSRIDDFLEIVAKEKMAYIHCAGGYRSMIAISILKSRGIHHVVDLKGGFKSIKSSGIETTTYVCPSTLK